VNEFTLDVPTIDASRVEIDYREKQIDVSGDRDRQTHRRASLAIAGLTVSGNANCPHCWVICMPLFTGTEDLTVLMPTFRQYNGILAILESDYRTASFL